MTRLIDADKLIKKIKKDKFAYVRSDYQSGYNDGIFHTEIVADNFPTVSVERDIPKAPTDQQLEEDGYGAWGSLYGHCPNCKGPVYYEQNYCEKCGQRLDWGNSDKEIDTVPVIRCKDCKHRPVYDEQKREMPPRLNIEYDEDGEPWIWDDDMTCPYLCGDSYYNQMPDDEQFCDRGERKEE